MSDDTTDTNWKARGLAAWDALTAWSRVHDVAAAIIGGLAAGYILGKVF